MAKGILWATVVDTTVVDGLATMAARPRHTHCTLAFGVDSDDDIVVANLGRRFDLAVTGLASNDEIEALVVVLPGDVPCTNAAPHITVSMADGVPPVRSNDMLVGAHTVEVLGFTVSVVVEFFAFPAR